MGPQQMGTTTANSGTGFSQECIGCDTAKCVLLTRASSRLKPVLLRARSHYGYASTSIITPDCHSK
jgi:hypothetical protein